MAVSMIWVLCVCGVCEFQLVVWDGCCAFGGEVEGCWLYGLVRGTLMCSYQLISAMAPDCKHF